MIERFELIDTYTQRGFDKEEIIDDAIYSTMQTIGGYTDYERELRGISDDFYDNYNLRRMYKDGQLKFLWNDKSGTKNPAYNIFIDIDGDGQSWQQLTNMKNRNALFVPEKMGTRYTNVKFKGMYEEVIGKMADDWLEKQGEIFREKGSEEIVTDIASAKEMYENLPASMDDAKDMYIRSFGIEGEQAKQFSSLMSAMNRLAFGLVFDKGQEGLNNLENLFNSIPFMPDVKFDINAIADMQQERMLNMQALDEARVRLGEELPPELMSRLSVEFDESHLPQLMNNPFAESIVKHEGYKSYVYDAKDPSYFDKSIESFFTVEGDRLQLLTELSGTAKAQEAANYMPYVDGSKISKAQYESLTRDGADPTIGPGLSLLDQANVNILESIQNPDGTQKYTLEGLMNGTQKLDRGDAYYVFYTRVAEKLQIANKKTKAYDLMAPKNMLLGVAITNLEYLGGGFNGPKFYEALDNFAATGDEKYIGVFGPYKEGDEFSIGQELYTDAVSAVTSEGVKLGGYEPRFKDVYDLVKAWSLGSFDVMPSYVLNPDLLNPNRIG